MGTSSWSNDLLSHPLVILIAAVLYGIEFFADKIPYVDSMWDSIHTFIRPLAGAGLSFMAASDMGIVKVPFAFLGGAIAADFHLTKSAVRVAVNTSPEPVTNSLVSTGEDTIVISILVLIAKHPLIAFVIVICLIVISLWILKKLFHLLKKVFSPSLG